MNNSTYRNHDHVESVLNDFIMAFKCPRGKFYPDKDYGREINKDASNQKDRLLASARQAAETLDGVYVKEVVLKDSITAEICVLINDSERSVSVSL